MKRLLLILALTIASCMAAALYFAVSPDSHFVVLNRAGDTLWKSGDADSAWVWADASDSLTAGFVRADSFIGPLIGNASNASLLQTKDTTALWNAKTLQGKDTTALKNLKHLPQSCDTASTATPIPNCDATDTYCLTALAVGATFGAPTGTPVNGQKLIIRLHDNGTARALTWNAAYRSRGATLLTTTTPGVTNYVGLIYNATESKWDCEAAN